MNQSTLISISIFIIFAIIFLVVYSQMNSTSNSNTLSEYFAADIKKITQAHIPSSETIQFTSWGLDTSTRTAGTNNAALNYQITKSTTNDFKYYDYLIVAKTTTHIYFIPAKIQGTMKTTMIFNQKKTSEHYPINNFVQSIQESTIDSVTIKFSLNNGEIKVIQFYDNLQLWLHSNVSKE